MPSPSTHTPQSAPTFSLRNSVMSAAPVRLTAQIPTGSKRLRINHHKRDAHGDQRKHNPLAGFFSPAIGQTDESRKREKTQDLHPRPSSMELIESLPQAKSRQRDAQTRDAAPFEDFFARLRRADGRVKN